MNQHSGGKEIELLYGIRIVIEHPNLTVDEITSFLEDEPTYSWNKGNNGKSYSMWTLESWTEDNRFFFDELVDILDWLGEKHQSVLEIQSSGGKITINIQLSGENNIGDELKPAIMKKAVDLGIYIGIEVFPKIVLR